MLSEIVWMPAAFSAYEPLDGHVGGDGRGQRGADPALGRGGHERLEVRPAERVAAGEDDVGIGLAEAR